ncbi:MAG: ROK family transcriptional regulator [Chloroflexota bacterium]
MLQISQKATRAQTKSHNKRLILKVIYDKDQISRAEIARLTGLTRPTVSSTVAELIDEGFVAEVGRGPSEGGKPPILLSVVDDSRHLIGIDLANSQFQGGVTDLRGNIIHRESIKVDDHNGEQALELVYQLVDKLIAAASRPLVGIGLGTPGLIDARRGVVRQAVNLDWSELPLRDRLETRYNLPVYIANDSQVAALGEYTFNPPPKTTNLIVVKIGRGVSAGIVVNGQLHYGDGFGAGEIGHVRVVEDGKLCLCGHYGCLETVVSSRALIEQATEVASNNKNSLLSPLIANKKLLTTNDILEALEAGDDTLQSIIAEMGYYLGIAVANLVGALNIRQIAIGGSIARFGEPLLKATQQSMQQRSMAILADKTQLTLSSLGKDIVVQGAAALLLANELGLVQLSVGR